MNIRSQKRLAAKILVLFMALSVVPATPAGRAGLQSGDVVTAIDNHPLYNIGAFWHAVSRASDRCPSYKVMGR